MAAAAINAMMNATMASSISVKPRWRDRAARIGRLLEVPVADVGIGAFAAFRAIGAEGIQVVLLAARAGEHGLVWRAPGILSDALDVAALAPVAHGGVIRPLRQRA